MSRLPKIYGCGISSAAGNSIKELIDVIKQEKHLFTRDPGLLSADGNNQIVCTNIPYGDQRNIIERLKLLLSCALTECANSLDQEVRSQTPAPLFLAIPQWLEELPQFKDTFQKAVSEALPAEIQSVTLFSEREVSGLNALLHAAQAIFTGTYSSLFVAGLDSRIAPFILDALNISTGVQGSSPYGIVPGEGAAAIFLSNEEHIPNLKPLGQLEAIDKQSEPEIPNSPQASILGKGHTAAIDNVTAHLTTTNLPETAIVDLNGERFRAEDFGFAIVSSKMPLDALHSPLPLPSYLGDIGAAYGIMAICIGANWDYSSSRKTLILGCSIHGERIAVLLGKP